MKICTIVVLAACCLMAGCKDKYMEYDPGLASVRFLNSESGSDSLTYSFALHPGLTEDVVEIPLRIMGYTSSQTRTVGIEIDREKTTAAEANYEIPSSEIPGGELTGIQKVVIKKTADLDNNDVVICLRLCGNENFAPAPVSEDRFRIVLSGRLVKQDWISALGGYSRVKHRFVIEVTGIGAGYDKWDSQQKIYYVGMLTKALYEYNKAHPGAPLTDENDMPVTF